MRITPIDILHQEFKKSFRGYNEIEVDEFKERVAKELEDLIGENADLKEQGKILKEKLQDYTSKETALQNILIIAEKTAQERLDSAKKEAELIIKEAELKSDEIIKEKEETLKKLNKDLEKLKGEKENFLISYKILLETHRQRLSDILGEKKQEDNNNEGK